jgi:hypothetical protein
MVHSALWVSSVCPSPTRCLEEVGGFLRRYYIISTGDFINGIVSLQGTMSSNATNAEVFVYMGAGEERVSNDVVRVRVDPSITSIPASAFEGRKKLTEVELCEGLVEIGDRAFMYCNHSITKINIPASVRWIRNHAFSNSLRTHIRLHDGIESIGVGAFDNCIFTNFRVPPLITVIPNYMSYICRSMFSLELPDNTREIGSYAFGYCWCLRNVAIPPNAVVGDEIFLNEGVDITTDLQLLFGNSDARITRELMRRFDGLPIHSIVYYQSYNQGVLQILIAAINTRSGQRRTLRSKLDPTGNQQDCLGMTPLHILTCSSVHDLDVYRLIVEKYPANLITEDRWGALPLLYAFWGAAPAEIIQFLLESYQSLYPGYAFNWTMMVETMGRCDTPKESIENLLHVRRMRFPGHSIDWEYLLDKFATPLHIPFPRAPFQERTQFLFKCGLSDRVEALAFKVWRDHITNMIQTSHFEYNNDNSIILYRIREKLAYFEDILPKLKEAMTILELALWKSRMNEDRPQEEATHCRKKIKTNESSIRRKCRVTCGASVVIRLVLPYLI